MRRVSVAAASLALAALATACARPHPAAPAVPPASAPAAAPPAPHAAPTLSIRWVRDSAEYRAVCLDVYRLAAERVEAAARERRPGSWAVVLDADETVLDNSTYQKERAAAGLGFTGESWSAWVARREAGAVPGAVAFTRRVRELGGAVAIVTNRTESECGATRDNLAALGAAFDAVLCKPDAGPGDKQPRFDALRRGDAAAGLPSLELVAYVGDNVYDFPGWNPARRAEPDASFADFGTRFFLLPNPMYGSWEHNPER